MSQRSPEFPERVEPQWSAFLRSFAPSYENDRTPNPPVRVQNGTARHIRRIIDSLMSLFLLYAPTMSVDAEAESVAPA